MRMARWTCRKKAPQRSKEPGGFEGIVVLYDKLVMAYVGAPNSLYCRGVPRAEKSPCQQVEVG